MSFQLGQRVCVTGSMNTRYAERSGVVVDVKVSQHSRPGVTLLDKYTVRFDDNGQAEFYESQIGTTEDSYAEISALPL
jgi:hypothetical protein